MCQASPHTTHAPPQHNNTHHHNTPPPQHTPHTRQPTVNLRVSLSTVIFRVFANAWICTQRATDRDLQSFFANAWICAQRATDRDLESVFVKRKVNAWICARHSTDRDLQSFLRMLGYAHNRQPTVILRVSSSREK